MLCFCLTVFMICLTCTNASFCGADSLPYYFEVSKYGQITLGCSKPTCLNFPPGALSKFYDVDGVVDGFVTVSKSNEKSYDVLDLTECDASYEATECFDDGEWLAGIVPETNTTASDHLSLRCCRNPVMKAAKFLNVVDITNNEIFKAGDVYEKGNLIAFDYINNIAKFENNNGINYELFINRIYCNLTFPFTPQKITKSNNIKTEKLFQAPLIEADMVADVVNVPDNSVIIRNNLQPTSGSNAEVNLEGNQGVSNLQQPLQEPVVQNPVSQVQQVNPNYQAPFPSSMQQLQIQSTPLQQPFQSVPMQTNFYNPSVAQQSSNTYGDSGYSASSSTCNPYLCFTADTIVTVYGGTKKRMDELKINDWVLSSGEDGQVYSRILSWLHKKPNLVAEFIKFSLSDGKILKMTKKHYVYIGNCHQNRTMMTNAPDYRMVHAEDVSLNDCFFVVYNNSTFAATQITKIEIIQEKGIYSPLTETGNIIVNDIFASCYSNIDVHPLQTLLPYMVQKIQTLFSFSSISNHTVNEIDLIPGFDTLFNIIKYYVLSTK